MVVNPSVHYLGVYGTTTLPNHDDCIAQNDRIKAERSSEYGADGAYNHQMCNSHGIRFDGRGWGRDGAANGGENGVWYNDGSRSLCVLVGTDDIITEACETGVRDWANEAVDVHGMQWPLKSHSEFVATSCCGDPLRGTVERINLDHAGRPDIDWSLLRFLVEDSMYSLVTAIGATAWFKVWLDNGQAVKRPIGDLRPVLVDSSMGLVRAKSYSMFGVPGPFVIGLDALNALPSH